MGLHDIRPDVPNPGSSTPASMRECFVEIVVASPHGASSLPDQQLAREALFQAGERVPGLGRRQHRMACSQRPGDVFVKQSGGNTGSARPPEPGLQQVQPQRLPGPGRVLSVQLEASPCLEENRCIEAGVAEPSLLVGQSPERERRAPCPGGLETSSVFSGVRGGWGRGATRGGMPERMCCTEPPVAWAGALCALEVAGWVAASLKVPSGGGCGS